jgi:hypothetical protein
MQTSHSPCLGLLMSLTPVARDPLLRVVDMLAHRQPLMPLAATRTAGLRGNSAVCQ